jgi:hypothetical protein
MTNIGTKHIRWEKMDQNHIPYHPLSTNILSRVASRGKL